MAAQGVTLPREYLDRTLKTSEEQARATQALVGVLDKLEARIEQMEQAAAVGRDAAVGVVTKHVDEAVDDAVKTMKWYLFIAATVLALSNLFTGTGTRWLETVRAFTPH